MTKQIIYRYLGTNGVLDTPIHIEDVYYVRMVKLRADHNKILTNGERTVTIITVPEDEVNNWTEISLDANN